MKNSFKLLFIIAIAGTVSLFGQDESGQENQKKSYTGTQSYETVRVNPVKGKKTKNVILMIGDGMGMVQVSAAWVANRGNLNIDNCTYTGFSRTWCANRLITDSGAAGSAMATGHKTNYHCIAVDTIGNPLPSLTDLAYEKGLKTGIVVTSKLTDATPASFCANNKSRSKEEEIAADFLNSNVDYFFGAGRDKFNKRSDNRDLLNEMKQKGYQICSGWNETSKITQGRVFSVMEGDRLPYAGDRADLFSEACLHAINLLNKNNKGFFAMFEGSLIDGFGHSNNLPGLIKEVLDFDQTLGKILQWAENDGQTLIIVVADHETGGLTLQNGDLKSGRVNADFSTKGHSGIMVPVYAYGPGSQKFSGIYENTEIFDKIVELLDLEN